MEAWSTNPKGGLGVEPKCIAGIYSSTHIALDATQDVVMITTYFLSTKLNSRFCQTGSFMLRLLFY